MYKLTVLVFFVSLYSIKTSAQTSKFSGSVMDTSANQGVKNAVVALVTVGDSILYKFSRADEKGQFSFKNIAAGKYILMTSHPLYGDYVDNVEIKENDNQQINIMLISKSKLLKEVIVKSGSPIKIKGDTVTYTADSFKVSANANVEELLRKLPGIQVDKNGQIKAMGETVSKVLVDGEEFFGDDPGMAVKNLRADAVKEVQVFDKKSDQAEFTGIDDGQTKKTINLKLKEDKKKGYFGKVELTGGMQDKIDHRYNNNILFNAFKGKRKFAGYLLQGNVGQNGLNWQERQQFGGEDDNITSMYDEENGGIMFMWNQGSDEDPYIDTRNGFFENLNTGLTYSNKWNNRHTLNYSPKLNHLQYDNLKNTFSQFQLGDSLFNTNSSENMIVNKKNIKNNLIYDWKIDSANSLKIITKLNVYNTKSNASRQSENSSRTGLLNNTTENNSTNNTDRLSFGSTLLFRHKFKKDRRTFSLNTDFNILNYRNTGYLYAVNQFFDAGNLIRKDTLDQKKNNDNDKKNISSRAVYTEPLSKKYSLEVNLEYSNNVAENNLTTFSKAIFNIDKYDNVVDSLSNHFDQNINTTKSGFKISYKYKKIKYGFGSMVGFTHFDLKDISNDQLYVQNFTNVFPSANFQYAYKPNHNITLRYDGRTIQPTISQLQQLRNNNDPLNEYIGNPLLKQSFNHNITASHNSYNFLKEMWTYSSINANITGKAITNSVTIDKTGKTITQPINNKTNTTIWSWMGLGKKLKKLNIDLNTNLQLNYTSFHQLVNNIDNRSQNSNATLGIGISKSKEKKYSVSLQNDWGYNMNRSTIYNKKVDYSTNSLNFNGTLYIKKVWNISNDIEYNYRQKTDEFSNNVNNTLWNARLERTFRNDEFTAFVLVRDLLNQNIGIDRSFYGNTLTEIRNTRLQRYWMLGFRWDFKNKSNKK